MVSLVRKLRNEYDTVVTIEQQQHSERNFGIDNKFNVYFDDGKISSESSKDMEYFVLE